jgi:acyl dehydratase
MTIQTSYLVPGYQLEPIRKTLKLPNLIAFSRYAHDYETGESVHCFPEVARKKGFPRAIAQGLMSHGYLSELLARRFGSAIFAGSRVQAKFIRPTLEGDTLTIGGGVSRVEPATGGQRVFLEVWCKNQAGDLLTVGEAEVTVPPDGER